MVLHQSVLDAVKTAPIRIQCDGSTNAVSGTHCEACVGFAAAVRSTCVGCALHCLDTRPEVTLSRLLCFCTPLTFLQVDLTPNAARTHADVTPLSGLWWLLAALDRFDVQKHADASMAW